MTTHTTSEKVLILFYEENNARTRLFLVTDPGIMEMAGHWHGKLVIGELDAPEMETLRDLVYGEDDDGVPDARLVEIPLDGTTPVVLAGWSGETTVISTGILV